jgi:two-component SAPR family response regulator
MPDDPPFNLLFTDIVMTGGTSGYELARTALSRWLEIKVVLISGFPGHKINVDGNHQNLPLLSKPCTRDDLERAIREVFGDDGSDLRNNTSLYSESRDPLRTQPGTRVSPCV